MSSNPESIMLKFAACRPALMRRSLALVRSIEERQDLVEETILHALRCADRFDHSRKAEPWMWKILVNLHRDNLRRLPEQGRPISFEAGMRTAFGPYEDDKKLGFDALMLAESTEAIVMENSLSEEMSAALQNVPALYRNTILMADVLQMTYVEIAAATNRPVGTVRSRLARGRNLLRLAYIDVAGDFPANGRTRQRNNPVGINKPKDRSKA